MAVCKPKKGNVIFSVEDRWLKLFGPIDQATVRWFAKFIHATNLANYAPICIFIDSVGGDANATLVIHSMLYNSLAPAITVVGRKARSGAFIVFQAGRKRMMCRKSELAFHWSEFEMRKGYMLDLDKLRAMADNLSATNKRFYRIIKSRTGLPMETVKKFFAEGKVLTAMEAKKFNLADEILERLEKLPEKIPDSGRKRRTK